ncbi:MAG: ACP S-malonyltransferase [Pseudomonadota bacterium]
MKVAFVCPGQGSQSVGMGAALADGFPQAKAVFDEVNEALGEDLFALMRDGPMDALTLTENAQPALMAVSVAAVRVLQAETGFTLADAAFFAGHSLGEYSALCAAGALELSDAARLLRLRGQAMQSAVPVGEGAMAALLGVDLDAAQAAIDEAVRAEGGVCEIANDNAPGQVVVSGAKAAVERAIEAAKAAGARRAMLLPVSAPFHCALMAPAAEAMDAALADVAISAPAAPVVSNVSAEPIVDPAQVRPALVAQVTGRVRWRESVARMAADGVDLQIEAGAGKVLTGLIKRIAPDVAAKTLGAPSDVAALAELLSAA